MRICVFSYTLPLPHPLTIHQSSIGTIHDMYYGLSRSTPTLPIDWDITLTTRITLPSYFMAYKTLIADLGLVVDDCTVLVVPYDQVIAHRKNSEQSYYLLSRRNFRHFLKQHTKPYKTHTLSCIGPKNKRKVKYPHYISKGFTIPFNHLTHFQQNSKGILIGVSH